MPQAGCCVAVGLEYGCLGVGTPRFTLPRLVYALSRHRAIGLQTDCMVIVLAPVVEAARLPRVCPMALGYGLPQLYPTAISPAFFILFLPASGGAQSPLHSTHFDPAQHDTTATTCSSIHDPGLARRAPSQHFQWQCPTGEGGDICTIAARKRCLGVGSSGRCSAGSIGSGWAVFDWSAM